jgi:hypothetical protein
MSSPDSKITKRKIISRGPIVTYIANYTREYEIARILMIDLYGRESVSNLTDMFSASGLAIQAQTSIYQQIIALHTAVHVCSKWENDLKITPEFEKEKAYLIQVFSILEKEDVSIFELLTSDLPIFREASRLYNKIKD